MTSRGPESREPSLPRIARWLLRRSPVPADARPGIEADLLELFLARRGERGRIAAHWRLYHDIASLWRQHGAQLARPTKRPAFSLLRDAGADLRYAARLFARQPAILLLAIAGLSLGLGIATAAFSIMNVALKGDGLVDSSTTPGILRTAGGSVSTVWKYDEFLQLRQAATRMSVDAVATDAAPVKVTASSGEPVSAGIGFVTGRFFAATGGRVVMGRPIEAVDESHAGTPPAVVSFAFWSTILNRDPSVVGRTIRVGRTDATIVGVADRGFAVPNNRLVWMPATAYGAVYGSARRTPDVIEMFGRLEPGASFAEAEAQLNAVAASLPQPAAATPLQVRFDTNAGLGRTSSGDTVAISIVVFAGIALVLVLACANVATVLVSTAITREREMGVRAALGASRLRIVRQLVTESLALGAVAAGLGLLLATWALPVIGTMMEVPAGTDIRPDLNVYLFLGVITLLTGIGAGLAPALHGRGVDLVTPLKGTTASQHRVAPRRLRSMLVMTQAAVSVLLIVMATLFVRATAQAATIDAGFRADGLYAVSARLPYGPTDGAAARSYWSRATSAVQDVPGVDGVTLAEISPFSGISKTSRTRDEPSRVVSLNSTRADYFETMGLRLLAGRTFTREEAASAAPVAVVSQSLARAYWPDRSPLGELLPAQIPLPPRMGEAQTGASSTPVRPTIVGVVTDAITMRLHERNTLAVYEPIDPAAEVFANLLVRVAPGATGALEQASQRLRALDPQIEVQLTSVASLLDREVDQPRLLATLAGIVGVIAIVLCVIGLYGLTASVVGQRTREMGVRVALGADPWGLLRMLMWQSLKPVAIGLAMGTAAALAAGRLAVATMFFGIAPHDPLAFVGAITTLLAAAIFAVVLPARRAATVDAAVVLKRT